MGGLGDDGACEGVAEPHGVAGRRRLQGAQSEVQLAAVKRKIRLNYMY